MNDFMLNYDRFVPVSKRPFSMGVARMSEPLGGGLRNLVLFVGVFYSPLSSVFHANRGHNRTDDIHRSTSLVFFNQPLPGRAGSW